MNFKVYVTSDAQKQIEESFVYYKNKVSTVVANKFKKEIAVSYRSLAINPFYKIRVNIYRAIPLNKFPFLVFYEVDEVLKEVKVLAIFNTNQSESKYPQ